MSHLFGVLVVFLTLVFRGHVSGSSIDVRVNSNCRIAGVVLVESRDRSTKFNYTMAEIVCQDLGLQLASREQVEKARGYGYETCSFGWVLENYGVIPRIKSNANCGRSKVGVLPWNIEAFGYAYCFNVSDVRINSCKPGLMVTELPSTVVVPTSGSTTAPKPGSTMAPKPGSTMAPKPGSTMAPKSGSTMAPTIPKTEPQTSPPLLITTYARYPPTDARTTSWYQVLVTTAARTSQSTTTTATTTMLQATTVEDTELPKRQGNQMPQKTERLIFGGLPTTLLILALLFFVAAVALAVCYIKKYKTHLFFTTKKHKKECVETKVFKDRSGDAENMKDEGQYGNAQEGESPGKLKGNSIEAEV